MREFALLAGSAAGAIFVLSQLPMLVKASRTKDLTSYSLANIGLANLGNLLYAVYLVHVPIGPAWAIHGFNTVTSGLMLVWRVRYRQRPATMPASGAADPVGGRRDPCLSPSTVSATVGSGGGALIGRAEHRRPWQGPGSGHVGLLFVSHAAVAMAGAQKHDQRDVPSSGPHLGAERLRGRRGDLDRRFGARAFPAHAPGRLRGSRW